MCLCPSFGVNDVTVQSTFDLLGYDTWPLNPFRPLAICLKSHHVQHMNTRVKPGVVLPH